MAKRRITELIYTYAYQNKINGMVYIGQTIDLEQRDKAHISQSEIEFDQAVNKFGRGNFDFWIISITYSEFEADQEEIYWIAEMRKQLGREMVYNKSDGGNTSGMLGRKHTSTAIEKMRKAATGRKASAETKEKMRLAKLGKTRTPHTPETIKKMRLTKLGKPSDPEAIRKREETRKINRTLYLFPVEQEVAICQEYLLGGITKKALSKKYECDERVIYRIIKDHQ